MYVCVCVCVENIVLLACLCLAAFCPPKVFRLKLRLKISLNNFYLSGSLIICHWKWLFTIAHLSFPRNYLCCMRMKNISPFYDLSFSFSLFLSLTRVWNREATPPWEFHKTFGRFQTFPLIHSLQSHKFQGIQVRSSPWATPCPVDRNWSPVDTKYIPNMFWQTFISTTFLY